ncbi:MAG: hypothetical protein KAJ24_01260, partial [Candidatus Aenigmarchaeota archaeon]|nr:hypothetical protein [Candidatus Aenigmarchaeota archaeon]
MTLFIRASILNGVAKERISMAVAIADPTASALLNDGLIPICGLAGAAVTSTSASLAVVLAVAYFVHELK